MPTMATINYNGMKLEEITTPQIFDPPKKCVVWDDDSLSPCEQYVIAIFPGSAKLKLRVMDLNLYRYQHCALLPDHPKPRRATNRELARWLAQGNGECILEKTAGMAEHRWTYEDGCEDEPANGYDSSDNELKVRKWEDTEWHEPTVDYMGLEEVK